MNILIDAIKKVIRFAELPQSTVEQQWTKTKAYQKRLGYVRGFWFSGALIMLLFPHPAFVLSAALFLTFLSFSFLEYDSEHDQ